MKFDIEKYKQRRIDFFTKNPILDKDDNPLTIEECIEYEEDVWDCGVPMSQAGADYLQAKWGERLGIK